MFGDTVNTAARMESNGEKGKIQVSEQTADLLKEAGKGSWIQPRKDKIEAKGKGQLQTYWLEPRVVTLFPSNTNSSNGSTTNASTNKRADPVSTSIGSLPRQEPDPEMDESSRRFSL